MNIFDYIDWRGDLSFEASPFNDVDNLVFSALAYSELDQILPAGEKRILEDLYPLYMKSGADQSDSACDPLPLLKKAAGSMRYKEVIVKDYVNIIDSERQIQFAAVTFRYSESGFYIAFRGTDNTLVGWREDCNFSFQEQTPGQAEAADYINKAAGKNTGCIIVGGHSKGGNFAVYGAAFCNEDIKRNRITKVYSNDGPGFNSKIAQSRQYHSILDKVVKIIPDTSLVGILLSGSEKKEVIESSAKGINQHNPYTWEVLGNHFRYADGRSISGLLLDETLKRWIDSLDLESRQVVVDTVFDSLEASGEDTIKEINDHKTTAYSAILKAIVQADPENRNALTAAVMKLFSAGKGVLEEKIRNRM